MFRLSVVFWKLQVRRWSNLTIIINQSYSINNPCCRSYDRPLILPSWRTQNQRNPLRQLKMKAYRALTSIFEAKGEIIENQVRSMADLLAADTENDHDAHKNYSSFLDQLWLQFIFWWGLGKSKWCCWCPHGYFKWWWCNFQKISICSKFDQVEAVAKELCLKSRREKKCCLRHQPFGVGFWDWSWNLW